MSILKVGMYASSRVGAIPIPNQNYLTFSSEEPFSVKFNQKTWDGVLEYSPDTQNWYEWDASEINSSGNVLYLRGSGNTVITGWTSNSMRITATVGVECSGNIMALLDHEDVENAVMGNRAFFYMFSECINLTKAPELPATVLSVGCYIGMFSYCSNLTTAPELPATVLADRCYENMFIWSGIAISETKTGIYQTPWRIPSDGVITVEPQGWNDYMLGNTSGTFRDSPSINTTYYQVGEPVPADEYLTFSSSNPFSIKFNQKSWDGVLEYSTDTQNWVELGTSEINSVDGKLYLRGSGNSQITGTPAFDNPADYAMQITATDGVECSGNIMSLLDHGDVDNAVMGSGAFASLFAFQDKLTTSPELPATELAYGCYAEMFCFSGIVAAPELPAMVLADGCYVGMFNGCTNLTDAPELPATELAPFCYSSIFEGCNLTIAPELPAMVLAQGCYNNMFLGCTSLVTAPELPATVLAENCYANMFNGCISLTTAPKLPAMQLVTYCYIRMFYGCISLEVAPELPATVLANYCYNGMFYGSGIAISETPTGVYQTLWRIPSVGTISGEPSLWNYDMLGNTNGTFTGDPSRNTTYYQVGEPEPDVEYITFSSEEPFSIKFNQQSWDGVLEYSTDTQNWVALGTSEIHSSGNALYLRGSGNSQITGMDALDANDWSDYALQITATEWVSCSGNIMSLLDHVNPSNAVMGEGAFACLFFEQDKLLTSPELPATVLADGCYAFMFCATNIAAAPELPAMQLAEYCYGGMLAETNLMLPPLLPATTLADFCYSEMLADCRFLLESPVLPATTLAMECYVSMLKGCTSLTVAPELPATELADWCYHAMFYDCTNLTVAPELPATVLAESCYYSMFFGCSNLTVAPELPAMQLANDCYASMFYNCTSLTVAPELPATVLAEGCYRTMFIRSGIKISETQTGDYPTPWSIPSVGTIASEPADWNISMLFGTSGTFTGAPDINKTYYQASPI